MATPPPRPPPILFLTTGGTIDKEYPRSQSGYAFEFGQLTAADRLNDLLANNATAPEIRVQHVCAVDSTEMTDVLRDELAYAIIETDAERIVVTHGTDTIIETALHVLPDVEGTGKRVAFTGAMRPERFKDSDAIFNLGASVAATALIQPGTVVVCLGGAPIDARCCARKGASFVHVADNIMR